MSKKCIPNTIIQDYLNGLTTRQLAKKYSCCTATIRYRLYDYGVTLRPNNWNQQRILNRKKKGLCNRCQKVSTNNKYCDECKVKIENSIIDITEEKICRSCSNIAELNNTQCTICKNRDSEYRKRKRQEQKKDVFNHYGGCKCNYCQISDLRVLTIDHLNNDGAAHRKRLKTSKMLYSDIQRRGYPPEYQVLCFNCNSLKHINGGVHPSAIPDDYII